MLDDSPVFRLSHVIIQHVKEVANYGSISERRVINNLCNDQSFSAVTKYGLSFSATSKSKIHKALFPHSRAQPLLHPCFDATYTTSFWDFEKCILNSSTSALFPTVIAISIFVALA